MMSNGDAADRRARALLMVSEMAERLDALEALTLSGRELYGETLCELPGEGLRSLFSGTLALEGDEVRRRPHRVPEHWIEPLGSAWVLHVALPGCRPSDVEVELIGAVVCIGARSSRWAFALELELPVLPAGPPEAAMANGWLRMTIPLGKEAVA